MKKLLSLLLALTLCVSLCGVSVAESAAKTPWCPELTKVLLRL